MGAAKLSFRARDLEYLDGGLGSEMLVGNLRLTSPASVIDGYAFQREGAITPRLEK